MQLKLVGRRKIAEKVRSIVADSYSLQVWRKIIPQVEDFEDEEKI